MATDPNVNQIQNTDSALWFANSGPNDVDPFTASEDPTGGKDKHVSQLPQFVHKKESTPYRKNRLVPLGKIR